MPSQLVGLCVDAQDPRRLARFWCGVLEGELADDGLMLLPGGGAGLSIAFRPTQEPKTGPNRMHLDLTSRSLEDQQRTVARSLELGGRHLDIGQDPQDEHVVLADPEGNEFCVIEPGNSFLAGCGSIGAINCDGSQEVGYFWSEALAWPLVWDQDEETAIQSPSGGTKIAWGGPPVAPKTGKNRWHLHVAAAVPTDHHAEVDRLESLGARRIDIGQGDVGWTVMADPDGNEFCVLPPR
ncbi:MAG TPA: VOC family protein [Nocardioidaceae bacterium]|nr:VOC family protein [Nocardioidaceae bacterium]